MAANKVRRRKLARISLKVRQIAESKGITRTKLSRLADVNYNSINLYWNNQQRDISLLTLWKIAQVLRVDVSELFVVEGE
jgi:transcriptional regulator with XRE-family HTH domain